MVIAAESQFGSVLYDASGQAIYLFDAETSNEPECYGECAEAWPPVLTTGAPRAKDPVQSDLLGTTRRERRFDAGHLRQAAPLLLRPRGQDQVLCHNVFGFGGTWLAVQPNGKPVAS